MSDPKIDLAALDLPQLAQFVGQAVNDAVLVRLVEQGFGGLRSSHGYVIQHLLRGPHSVTELARLLGVSQQAASKSVAELARLRCVENAPSDDARVRKVRLSARGRAAVQTTRDLRRELDGKLRKAAGASAYEEAKAVLVRAIEQLGASDVIQNRRVRPPR